MNAFLTGSQVYGTPHEKSDIDLVVLVSPSDLKTLCTLHSDAPAEDYEGVTSSAIRFGKLNLLCVTTPEDLAVWREGTDELTARKPVTRPEAVELFKAKREALRQRRIAGEVESLMEIDRIADIPQLPEILTDDDRDALEALGDDLATQLLDRSGS